MQLSFFIQFINYRRTTCKIKCPEDDEIEKSNELPTLIWRQQIHKIIELYKWSYLISLIIYIPYLTHYQFITFGIYFERRSFIIRFPKMSMTSQFLKKKRLFEVSKDFNLQLSYNIDWFDSPITDLPKGGYFWRFDAKDKSPFIINLSSTVFPQAYYCNLIFYYRISSFILEAYLFSLTKTTYPRVRKKSFRQLNWSWRVKER